MYLFQFHLAERGLHVAKSRNFSLLKSAQQIDDCFVLFVMNVLNLSHQNVKIAICEINGIRNIYLSEIYAPPWKISW